MREAGLDNEVDDEVGGGFGGAPDGLPARGGNAGIRGAGAGALGAGRDGLLEPAGRICAGCGGR